jgi:hypothetical protein
MVRSMGSRLLGLLIICIPLVELELEALSFYHKICCIPHNIKKLATQ